MEIGGLGPFFAIPNNSRIFVRGKKRGIYKDRRRKNKDRRKENSV
jgi:hypothetical protein